MPLTARTVDAGQAPRQPRRHLGLPPLSLALGSCHFVARAGGFVGPILVLYLTQEQQLSPTTAGAVLAAVGVGDLGSQLLGGWLGDRIGRRRTMLLSFLGTSLALVALGAADTTPTICAAAVGFGLISELFRPAGSAAVADLPPEERVRAYGLLGGLRTSAIRSPPSRQGSWQVAVTAFSSG